MVPSTLNTAIKISKTWNGRKSFARDSPSAPRNREGKNFSGSSQIRGSLYSVHPLLSEYNKLLDLLMAQWSGMTMVALGSLHPDTSTSSTTPWGTPRGTTGRSRITCDVKVANGIWCNRTSCHPCLGFVRNMGVGTTNAMCQYTCHNRRIPHELLPNNKTTMLLIASATTKHQFVPSATLRHNYVNCCQAPRG